MKHLARRSRSRQSRKWLFNIYNIRDRGIGYGEKLLGSIHALLIASMTTYSSVSIFTYVYIYNRRIELLCVAFFNISVNC